MTVESKPFAHWSEIEKARLWVMVERGVPFDPLGLWLCVAAERLTGFPKGDDRLRVRNAGSWPLRARVVLRCTHAVDAASAAVIQRRAVKHLAKRRAS